MTELITRPKKLIDFIGKQNIKESLNIYIQSSIKQNKQLEHILFYGTAGVGKTSLSTIIANELDKNIHYVQGPSLDQISDILDMISMINEGDIVFIDEAHKINPKCLEILYSILEDFVVDIKLGKELNSQYSRLSVPKFTMICSTTNIGKLPIPFIDRFGIKFFIDFYSDKEIYEIISLICKNNNIKIEENEIQYIAEHSKGTPRIALNLFNRFYDYRLINKTMTKEKIFKMIGIFPKGLNELDVSYLKVLNNNSLPIGLKTISQQLFIDDKTIEFIVEPYLLKLELIKRKSNGRIISDIGKQYLKTI